MPELPDLEAVQGVLTQELVGQRVVSVEVVQTIPIRLPTPQEFASSLEGNTLRDVTRRGKFLVLAFDGGLRLAINPMLTGHLQYSDASERRRAKTCFVLDFENGRQLRYFDDKLMGKVYLVPEAHLGSIPGWDEMGPDALSPEVTLEVFRQRLRRHPGQIKNILVNAGFLAGIGNAYADEILFAAGIYPYRRRGSLRPEEVERLYRTMGNVLREATEVVAGRMGEEIHLKIRDFLKVHGKGGRPCPQCGNVISEITANQRLTNFCRRCQPMG